MKSVYKIASGFVLLLLLGTSSIAQIKDDVNRSNSKPKDTSAPKRPDYVKVDTTRPVPVETKTLVRSVLKLKNILVSEDALAICRILNPDIYQHDSTLSDHTIILPNLPDPPSEIRRAVKDDFKKELKPDAEVNRQYSFSALKFDTLANVFTATEFTIPGADTGNLYTRIKKFLPGLANLTKQAAEKTKRTSQQTVATLTKEVDALNQILQETTETNHLADDDIPRIYSLMTDINILVYMINDKKLDIDPSLGKSLNPVENIYLAASYSIPAEEYATTSGDDDPRKFNIYVFRKSILETTGDRNPEMDMYTISYVIPAFANDSAQWWTIPKMASTTSKSFPPARFKFSIKDNRTGTTYEAITDLFNAAKDPDDKWTLMDLFDPHPVYRLMFLIP